MSNARIGVRRSGQHWRTTWRLRRRTYQKGIQASPTSIALNPIRFDTFLPQLNYTAPSCGLL